MSYMSLLRSRCVALSATPLFPVVPTICTSQSVVNGQILTSDSELVLQDVSDSCLSVSDFSVSNLQAVGADLSSVYLLSPSRFEIVDDLSRYVNYVK